MPLHKTEPPVLYPYVLLAYTVANVHRNGKCVFNKTVSVWYVCIYHVRSHLPVRFILDTFSPLQLFLP